MNTDDRPLIECLAPRTHRAVMTGAAQWVVGAEQDRLYADLFDALPPERDPYLQRLSEGQLRHVAAGLRYALFQGARGRGTRVQSRVAWADFLEVSTPSTRRPESPAGQAGFGAAGFGASEGS